MGTLKKAVRSEVRRATRLVLGIYAAKRGVKVTRRHMNKLVKSAEADAVPKIMSRLRNGNT